jgi:hypothetical protein
MQTTVNSEISYPTKAGASALSDINLGDLLHKIVYHATTGKDEDSKHGQSSQLNKILQVKMSSAFRKGYLTHACRMARHAISNLCYYV